MNEGAPAGARGLQLYPATDGSRATCLWESDTVKAIQHYVDSTLGDSSVNTCWQVDTGSVRRASARAADAHGDPSVAVQRDQRWHRASSRSSKTARRAPVNDAGDRRPATTSAFAERTEARPEWSRASLARTPAPGAKQGAQPTGSLQAHRRKPHRRWGPLKPPGRSDRLALARRAPGRGPFRRLRRAPSSRSRRGWSGQPRTPRARRQVGRA